MKFCASLFCLFHQISTQRLLQLYIHHKSKSESESSLFFRIDFLEERLGRSESSSEFECLSCGACDGSGLPGDSIAKDNIKKASNSRKVLHEWDERSITAWKPYQLKIVPSAIPMTAFVVSFLQHGTQLLSDKDYPHNQGYIYSRLQRQIWLKGSVLRGHLPGPIGGHWQVGYLVVLASYSNAGQTLTYPYIRCKLHPSPLKTVVLQEPPLYQHQ